MWCSATAPLTEQQHIFALISNPLQVDNITGLEDIGGELGVLKDMIPMLQFLEKVQLLIRTAHFMPS